MIMIDWLFVVFSWYKIKLVVKILYNHCAICTRCKIEIQISHDFQLNYNGKDWITAPCYYMCSSTLFRYDTPKRTYNFKTWGLIFHDLSPKGGSQGTKDQTGEARKFLPNKQEITKCYHCYPWSKNQKGLVRESRRSIRAIVLYLRLTQRRLRRLWLTSWLIWNIPHSCCCWKLHWWVGPSIMEGQSLRVECYCLITINYYSIQILSRDDSWSDYRSWSVT